MKKWFFLLAVVLVGIVSCRKDQESTESTTIYPPGPTEYVKTTIGGIVVNELGVGVPDAKVQIGNKTMMTDINGVFRFNDIVVNAHGAYIKVDKSYYFHGSRTVIVSPATRNTVKIQLLSNSSTKFVDASNGGLADYSDYSVRLPAGGIVTATGLTYSGQVGVAAKWLDPTDDDFGIQMPGRLEGVNLQNERTGMVSMGMLAVELKDAAGDKLQIKPGFEAEIRVKVDPALRNSAPATIPLWYFDETAGLWVEEGEAKLVGGYYEGKVKHFSFWNCDYPGPLVEMKFKVVDTNGNPIEGANIVAQLVSTNWGGQGYTDNTGRICGLIPKNELFNVSVYAPNSGCSTPLHQQQIGPYAQNDSICFTIDLGALTTYTVTGTLIDCDGAPVANGYVQVIGSNEVVWTDNAGEFEINLIRCTPLSTVEIKGYDLEAFKETQPATLDVSSGNVNAGNMQACDALQTYLTYNFNGANFIYPDATSKSFDSIPGGAVDNIFISFADTDTMANTPLTIGFSFANINGVGTFPCASFYAYGQVNGNNFYHYCQDCSNVTITVTEFNGIGGYISGTFAGTLLDEFNNNQPVSVSGSFRLLLE